MGLAFPNLSLPISARRGALFSLLILFSAGVRTEHPVASGVSVQYVDAADPLFASLAKSLREKGVLEETTSHLNTRLTFSAPVLLRMQECGEVAAYYDSAKAAVVVCYELLPILYDVFDRRGSRTDIEANVHGALSFALYHEIAHALFDLHGLPITGKEEDAADQLAALLLLSRGEEGTRMLVASATAFSRSKEKLNNSRYAAEHALSKQRAFNLLCWVQGHDSTAPIRHRLWRSIPATRVGRCRGEFRQLAASWNTILGNALKLPLP